MPLISHYLPTMTMTTHGDEKSSTCIHFELVAGIWNCRARTRLALLHSVAHLSLHAPPKGLGLSAGLMGCSDPLALRRQHQAGVLHAPKGSIWELKSGEAAT